MITDKIINLSLNQKKKLLEKYENEFKKLDIKYPFGKKEKKDKKNKAPTSILRA